ncbi:LOW QUALITY PROTEIN: 5-formyltetrahydrofolate cyclo-ligase-like [Chelonus insularis]|uniref:LOW QUALITY PROTEIN: 5-formyltetrahydrofolate cyclo-ligase-like n=1 Tax=Chelonus insularis TaxID=460826 RepID=UPI00158DD22C|nr:LOW QUALITY PROTEIN: 5-formyltetrahydrofolate cyclo-ligase-like [Chelonus insularis]
MDAIKLAKNIVRKEIKGVINNMSQEEKVRQSDTVCKKVFDLPEFQSSERISIYLSTDNEINTFPILAYLFKIGKQVFVPKYNGKNMMMVRLHSLEDFDNLPLTKWMIKQPNDNNREDALKTGGLDLIICPGVAFTRTGKRLGHGMGYYDKFMNNYYKCESHNKNPHLIGVCFNEQIKDDIPTSESDVTLDKVISEN